MALTTIQKITGGISFLVFGTIVTSIVCYYIYKYYTMWHDPLIHARDPKMAIITCIALVWCILIQEAIIATNSFTDG